MNNKDILESIEYAKLLTAIKSKNVEDAIDLLHILCEYVFSMGEAQGHYDSTGNWKT